MSTITSPRAPSRALPAFAIVLCQLVGIVSLAPWMLVTGFSLLTTSGGALLPRPLLYLLWVYPVLPLGCAVAAWLAFSRGDTRRAVRLSAVPLVAALPLLAYAWYMTGPVR